MFCNILFIKEVFSGSVFLTCSDQELGSQAKPGLEKNIRPVLCISEK
jgi:hypothetical protein